MRYLIQRYLIQIEPTKAEEVKRQLDVIGIKVVDHVFDYIVVDIDPALVPKVKTLPYVIDVIEDRPVGVVNQFKTLLDILPAMPWEGPPVPRGMILEAREKLPPYPIPINKKMETFLELAKNPLTLHQAFTYAAAETKERWVTGDSRKMVGADVAEKEDVRGKSVKVAVLDTGVDPLTPSGPFWAGSKSSVDGQPLPYDGHGHGTHVGGTIAGRSFPTPWGTVKGVAVDADVAHFKCLSSPFGFGMTSWILRSIVDALEWGADIYNLSLGGADEDYRKSPYHRIIGGLTRMGKIFCVAAGNDGDDPQTIASPGSMPDSLTVGAIDSRGELARFSSRGPTLNKLVKPDCTAPGVFILTSTTAIMDMMGAAEGPKLAAASGTSMATPAVAGTVALALQYARQRGKTLTTDHIKEALSLYGHTKNNDDGWGLLTYQMLKRYIDEKL